MFFDFLGVHPGSIGNDGGVERLPLNARGNEKALVSFGELHELALDHPTHR